MNKKYKVLYTFFASSFFTLSLLTQNVVAISENNNTIPCDLCKEVRKQYLSLYPGYDDCKNLASSIKNAPHRYTIEHDNYEIAFFICAPRFFESNWYPKQMIAPQFAVLYKNTPEKENNMGARFIFRILEKENKKKVAQITTTNLESAGNEEANTINALLLKEVEKRALTMGCNTIEIHCARLETDGFYEEQGYKRDGNWTKMLKTESKTETR